MDGTVYQQRTPADVGGNQWVFNKPFYLILNLAVGGYWPGDPDGSTAFPQQLLVDYVKVTTGSGTADRRRGHHRLAGKCVDVQAAGTANGTPVQLYDCNGTAAQQWTVGGDGTIRALGKCLDVDSAAPRTAPGATGDCNGSAAQQWVVSAARRHRQPAGEQVPRRDGQQLRQRHPAADLDLRRHRQPEVDAGVTWPPRSSRRWSAGNTTGGPS